MRLEKTLVSARGFVFFVLTNRYVFHVVLFFIAVGTILSQLQTKQVAALDAGQNSLLYSLVTQGQEETVEEDLQNTPASDSVSYLGLDTLQGQERGIDYGYEEESPADLTIPGSIAVQPHSDFDTEDPIPTIDTDPTVVATPETPTTPRTGKTQNYTVRSGDTVATIAKRFGVNSATILWANNLTNQARINPGDVLRIPPESGVLHVVKKNETAQQIANLYGISITDLRASNQLSNNSTLSVEQELMIPDGKPRSIATATPPSIRTTTPPASAPVIRPGVPLSTIAGKTADVYQELTDSKSDGREKPADAPIKATTKLQWPTDLHVINQYYGWKHTGVDIDGDYTNAIYAADEGTVVEAGWNNGGYGLQVVIDHGNGFKTRYGHSSKLFVKVGDKVTRGQTIAMIGTTGRSTGTHLHFEVYVNGKRTNPLAYTK